MKTMAKITAVAVFFCSLAIGASAPVRAQTPLLPTPRTQLPTIQSPRDQNKGSGSADYLPLVSYDAQLSLDSDAVGGCPLVFLDHNIDKYRLIFHRSDASLLTDQTAPLHLTAPLRLLNTACVEKASPTSPLTEDYGEGIHVSVSDPQKFEEMFLIASKLPSMRDRGRIIVTKPLEGKCEQTTKVCISSKSNETKVSVEFTLKCKNMPEVTVSTDGASIKLGHFSVSYSLD